MWRSRPVQRTHAELRRPPELCDARTAFAVLIGPVQDKADAAGDAEMRVASAGR